MKVLVSGSSGLLGSEVVTQLTAAGHYVVRLVRSNPDRSRGDILWDPVAGSVERRSLHEIDAVIHLAGESLLGVWTGRKKERLHRSRVAATEYLAEAIAAASPKPKVLVCASAIGFYGDCHGAWVTESAPAGSGFLSQLAREWEEATRIAEHAGIRVVNARIGIVLSRRGGALAGMLPAFKLGLGGPIGSGKQYMSWISIVDAVRGMLFAMETPSISGPVNLTAPQPVTSREFARTLGHVLSRPAFLPVPSTVLKLLPGGMGREMFLSSARVEPEKLQKAGFKFKFTDLELALEDLMNE